MAGSPETRESTPSRVRDGLIVLACLCIVVASLRAAATFFVPVVVALILSLICIPTVRRLERIGLPSGVAILLVLLALLATVVIVPLVVGTALNGFQDALPGYQERIAPLFARITDGLRDLGVDVPEGLSLAEWYDTGALFQMITNAARGAIKVLSNAFVVLLVTVFILIEARLFSRKLERAFGTPEAANALKEIVDKIGGYISAKASMSLLTGALVTLLNTAVGIDFALLWGFVAFVFNFVPNIGSILAAIPAILLAAIQFGPGIATLVGLGYMVINVGISNGLEPQVMGNRLGLSTLVVIVSLFFWFWVWGPVGMLLSAPLTMVVKIALEQNEDSRPYTRMLERYRPERG